MTVADSRTLMLALRAWLDNDERNARRVVELIYAKPLAGHFGYFRFLLDAVDGKIRPTAEEEMTGDDDGMLLAVDEGREAGTARAA
jgi:hypothetical protein